MRGKCFLCNSKVLGLIGQDAFLDPYNLTSKCEGDNLILNSEAFGECHIKCLIDSPFGILWSDILKRNDTENFTEESIKFINDWFICRNERGRENRIRRSDGYFLTLNDKELKNPKKKNGYNLFDFEDLFDFELPEDVVLANSLCLGGEFALLDILNNLKIAKNLVDPLILEQSLVIIDPKKVEKIDKGGFFIEDAKISYSVGVEDEVWEIVRGWLP